MRYNRKLAPHEQSTEIFNRCANSFNIITISHIKGKLNEEIVRQSLNFIQSRHVLLNFRIVGSLDDLRFESGATKIPLRVVHRQHHNQWQDIVLEELNIPIASNKCLARAILINFEDESRNCLLTVLHHAISDGLSSIQLQAEVLTSYQKIATSEIEEYISVLAPLPDIQELMPRLMQGRMAIIKSILLMLKLYIKLFWYRPKSLSFEKCVPIRLRQASMVQRKLNQATTIQLVEACRKEKTTVQGALCAAMMFVVAKQLRGKGLANNLHLSCSSYVDLRRRVKPEIIREHLGLFASAITSFHILNKNTSFWDLTRDVKQQLAVSLNNGDIFRILLICRKIYEYFLARPNESPMTVNVTNIGRIDISHNYGLFTLEEVSFVPAQATFGGTFSVAVATFQEIMILNFVFSEPSLSRKSVEILADDVISCIINNICNEQKNHDSTRIYQETLTQQ